MLSQTGINPLLEQLDKPAFQLVWTDSRAYLQRMEIYAPNEQQCFRLVELMRAYADLKGWNKGGVMVDRRAELAGDGWYCLTLKFPPHQIYNLETAFRVAQAIRGSYSMV